MSGIQSFFQDIQEYISQDRLISSASDLVEHEKNTLGLNRIIGGIVRPINEEEIIHIVKFARRRKVHLYPISTGKNWGYGGKTPQQDHCIILDLGLMTKIIDFNKTAGVVTLQPGVTHANLYQYLQDNNLDFMVPTIGAGPDVSLVGNALERGFGLTPITDHFSAVISMRAVLADGSIYMSSIHNNNTKLHQCFKWGVGPYLDGIFTQSNLGIITEMSIRLEHKSPESFMFISKFKKDKFSEAVKVVCEISSRYKSNVGNILLLNSERVSLSLDQKKTLDKNDSYWVVIGAVYGEKSIATAIKKEINKKISQGSSGKIWFSRRRIKGLRWFSNLKILRYLSGLILHLKKLLNLYDMVNGKPSKSFLESIAYKYVSPKDKSRLNPDLDNVGLIWFAPLVPMEDKYLDDFVVLCSSTFEKYGMTFTVSFSAFTHACFDATLPILFDKQDQQETKNAQKCYQELFLKCKEKGYLPYRVGIQGMDLLVDEESTFWQIANKIKEALDPDNIISPSRYSIYQGNQE